MPSAATVVEPPSTLSPVGGREVWAALGRAGRLRAVYRGGDPANGVDPAGLAHLLSEVDAEFGIPATLSVCVQLATAVPLLDPPARAAALDGSVVTALAATDEAAGSDLSALTTSVSIGETEVVLSGRKRWITNATHADQLLVLARHRPGRHFTNFTWVLAPVATPGVRITPAGGDLFGDAGVGHVDLSGVRLPRSAVVGRPGRGLVSFAAHIAVERLAGAQWAVALCRRVLEDTRAWLTARDLWRLEAVRQRYAACVVKARELKALCDALGERAARHDAGAGALLKSAAGPAVEHVLAECAHLRGADGFADGGLQHLRAQAAVFGIGGGTTEVVLSMVADSAPAVLAELAP